jgi:hypothetical protein
MQRKEKERRERKIVKSKTWTDRIIFSTVEVLLLELSYQHAKRLADLTSLRAVKTDTPPQIVALKSYSSRLVYIYGCSCDADRGQRVDQPSETPHLAYFNRHVGLIISTDICTSTQRILEFKTWSRLLRTVGMTFKEATCRAYTINR